MHDRHAEVMLQLLDDIERAPGRAEHVECLGSGIVADGVLDETVDPIARQLRHFVEGDVDAGHVETVKAGIDEVFSKHAIDVATEIGHAEEARHLERAQGIDVAGAGGEDPRLVVLLPFADQLLLIVIAEHHEWRRAGGVDDIDAHAGELGDLCLITGNGLLEFVDRATEHVEAQRDEADAFR